MFLSVRSNDVHLGCTENTKYIHRNDGKAVTIVLCNIYRKNVDDRLELWYITIALEIERESVSRTV